MNEPLSVTSGEDAYHRFYFEIFHIHELIQTQVRAFLFYSVINLFEICILIVVETIPAICSQVRNVRSSVASWGQLRVPIVTGAGDRWKMMRISLPCESRWACAASWACRKTSSVVPGAPATTEPTTPPALLRSPVTCHEPRPAKINHRPINLNVTLNVHSLHDTLLYAINQNFTAIGQAMSKDISTKPKASLAYLKLTN